jgi:hypothetical protein
MAATGNEVWAEPLSINRERGILTIPFSTTPHTARDPITLSRWGCHVRALAMNTIAPRSHVDQTLLRWIMGQSTSGQVTLLANQADAGLDLRGADVPLDARVLGPGYCEDDHNGSILWLGIHGPWPVALGPVGDDAVALDRLSRLYQLGGRPVVAARIQANRRLYEPVSYGSAGLVVLSFDPRFTPHELEQLAERLYDLKEIDSEHVSPPQLFARNSVLANEDCWHYHRRVRVPPDLTGTFLADRYLSPRQPRLLPVLAQPDETGGCELIPHDRVAHFWPGQAGAMFALRSAIG